MGAAHVSVCVGGEGYGSLCRLDEGDWTGVLLRNWGKDWDLIPYSTSFTGERTVPVRARVGDTLFQRLCERAAEILLVACVPPLSMSVSARLLRGVAESMGPADGVGVEVGPYGHPAPCASSRASDLRSGWAPPRPRARTLFRRLAPRLFRPPEVRDSFSSVDPKVGPAWPGRTVRVGGAHRQ